MRLRREEIDSVLAQRLDPERMLPQGTINFVKAVVDINAVQLDLLANEPRDLSLEELQSLRNTLVDKYALAQAHIEHSMISYGRVVDDFEDLKHSLSDSFISKRREELTTNLLIAKKRINELSKKKKEIEEINEEIKRFALSSSKVQMTEEELCAVFGDDAERAKTSPYVTRSEDGEYTFNAQLSSTASELTKLQESLKKSIAEYTSEIATLKASWREKLAKFEQIKRIMGVVDEAGADADADADAGDEEGDVVMDGSDSE